MLPCKFGILVANLLEEKMIKNYIYGAHAVLLCYDITSKENFQNLEDWYRLVRKTFEKSKLPYVALVGNKTDMSHARAVSRDKHNAFVEENDMYSYFMSAKTGDMVSSSLFRIAADLAGIVLTKGEVDVTVKPVTAAIVDYERHDSQEKRELKLRHQTILAVAGYRSRQKNHFNFWEV